MSALRNLSAPAQRAVRLEQATIAYNAVEGVLAVGAGLVAGLVEYFAVREGREAWAGEIVCADGCL